jgi:hypothetical protein
VSYGTIGAGGTIGTNGHIGLDEEVRVCCTTLVVTWKQSLKGYNTIRISLLNSAQESSIKTALAGLDTAVVAGRVAVPYVDVKLRHRLTGAYVDILDFKIEIDALLVLDNVLADHLASDIIGAVGDFRREDAGGVCSENVTGESVGCVTHHTRHIVIDVLELLEEGQVATVLFGLCGSMSATSMGK